MVVSGDKSTTYYLTCDVENEFKSQCAVRGEIQNFDFIPERHLDVIGDALVGFSNHIDP